LRGPSRRWRAGGAPVLGTRGCVADSASVVVSQAAVAGLCGARGAVVVAGGRAAWLPPPPRGIWPGGRGAGAPDLRARCGAQEWPQTRATLQIPRRQERLRELATQFRRFHAQACVKPAARRELRQLSATPRREIAILRVEETSPAVLRQLRHFCSGGLRRSAQHGGMLAVEGWFPVFLCQGSYRRSERPVVVGGWD
jgi:hypothetical protein